MHMDHILPSTPQKLAALYVLLTSYLLHLTKFSTFLYQLSTFYSYIVLHIYFIIDDGNGREINSVCHAPFSSS
jgi:hypothetical protein